MPEIQYICTLHFIDTKIEDNSRVFKLNKANFDSEVNTAVRKYLFIPDFIY
jgi:hypothetical protein